MIKINYESDFKLTERTEEGFADIAFEFAYFTDGDATYKASYDGNKCVNCKRNGDGSVTVIFNHHGLKPGKLKVRRELFMPDSDFPDGVYNIVSNDITDVMLVEGRTEGLDVDEEFRPPYVVSVEIVDSLDSDAPDQALSANQGRILNERINVVTTDVEEIGESIKNISDTLEDVNAAINANATAILSKQPLLTGDEFKTINGQSIFGEGDIEIKGDTGGGITPEEKAEIQAELAEKIESSPTEAVIEEIEPSVVSDALRKSPQTLTEAEQTQARANIKAQKELQLSVKDNGNIVISNIQGQTKEFMPATPSGDPMHYAYESAGAEYNDTGNFILKNAPWEDMVDTIADKAKWGLDVVDASRVKQMTIGGVVYNYATENRTSPEGGTYLRYFLVGQSDGVWVEDETKVLHLPKCWYLNGLGDITDVEMRSIYAVKHMSYAPFGSFAGTPCRTFIDKIKHTGSDLNFGDRYHRCKNVESIYSYAHRVVNAGFNYTITSTSMLKYFLPTVTLVTYANKIFGALGDAALRVLYIGGVRANVQFPSKYISKLSILYVINNVSSALTSAITIQLHADAYARLVADADIVAALEAKNTALEGTGGSVSLIS